MLGKKNRGRPPAEDPKNNIVYCRLTEEEKEKLEFVKEKTGENTSEILRRMLNMAYNLEVYKE